MYKMISNTPNTKKGSVLWGYAPIEDRIGLFYKDELPKDFIIAPYLDDCIESARKAFRLSLASSGKEVPFEIKAIHRREWLLDVKRLGYLDMYKMYEHNAYIEELHLWIERHNIERHFLKSVPNPTQVSTALTQKIRDNKPYADLKASYSLNLSASAPNKTHISLSECNAKATTILKLFYAKATSPFLSEEMPIIAEKIASNFAHILNNSFEAYMEDLETLAWFKNKTYAYDKLEMLLKYAQSRLFYAFLEDIRVNREAYTISPYTHYEKMVEIKTIKSVESSIIKKTLRPSTIINDGFKWNNMSAVLNAIQTDAIAAVERFCEHADIIYQDYINEIEACIDMIGNSLPKDSLKNYIYGLTPMNMSPLVPRVYSKELKKQVYSRNDLRGFQFSEN